MRNAWPTRRALQEEIAGKLPHPFRHSQIGIVVALVVATVPDRPEAEIA